MTTATAERPPKTPRAPDGGEDRAGRVVAPFGIEADHPRNCDLLIQSVPGLRLRGAISSTKSVTDVKTGQQMVPRDQAAALGALPAIPGMQIHVNPAKRTYKVIDPLHGNKDLCARIRRAMALNGVRVTETLDGAPPQEGVLDQHRMKSLVREMHDLLLNNEAKIVQGPHPSRDDIEDLPGKFLLNPGSRIPNGQPVYEKDLQGWVDSLNRSGG